MPNRSSSFVRRGFAAAALCALTFATGCVSTGSVDEQQPLSADILASKTARVAVHAADPDWQKDAAELQRVLAEEFKKKGWWTVGSSGDVTFDITFQSFDKGSKGMRAMNLGGEAELTAAVTIKDSKGKSLAQLTVTGNSKRQTTTSVGGYDTSWGDSLPGRAVRALAEQVVEYVESKQTKS